MCQPQSFARLFVEGFHSSTRWFALALSLGLLVSCFFLIVSPVHGAQKHGCGQDPPPLVAGTPTTAPATPGIVLINEVLSNPRSTWNCSEPAGVFSQVVDSWIELYNPQSQPLDLYAARATISLDGGTTSTVVPFGSAISAGGFLVIFPLKSYPVAVPPAWNVVLSIGTTSIDTISVPVLAADQSYARMHDGSSIWQIVGQPTIGASNGLPLPTATATLAGMLSPTTIPPTLSPPTTSQGTVPHGRGIATVPPDSSGTQPPWGSIRLPSDATPTVGDAVAPFSPQSPDTPSLPPAGGQSNPLMAVFTGLVSRLPGGPRGATTIVIAVLALLLLGALFWCWRLFRVPDGQPDESMSEANGPLP